MYTEQLKDRPVSDENIDCPFVELKLIQMSGTRVFISSDTARKSSLPSEIIVAAAQFVFGSALLKRPSRFPTNLCDQWTGQVFKLTESAVYSAVDDVATKFEEISISDMAGLYKCRFARTL